MNQESDIKAEAARLGFEFTGITQPRPPRHLDVYKRWLAAGRHAGMAYLASERGQAMRANPAALLPGCQSILVTAVRYAAPTRATLTAANGRIAAYAASGQDYHNILPPRLDALREQIERITGRAVQARSYTDTGPILERDLASQAGLGWIGKNTCLIRPGHGSYFFLAELLLDVALEADEPWQTDHCGSCRRCIEACPTGCIQADRTLDANRCLAYLTIEHKGPIPLELRPAVGNWIFGCDICQSVCPWNQRFAAASGDPAFTPTQSEAPNLLEELQLTPQDFNQKFRGSALQRTRRRGYLRNTAIALGNSGDPAAVPVLAATLQNEAEPWVRGAAAWALGRMAVPAAQQALQGALQHENDPAVLIEVKSALNP